MSEGESLGGFVVGLSVIGPKNSDCLVSIKLVIGGRWLLQASM